MHWADELAQAIKKRDLSLEWVDDMKTPSGRIHVGSLRGVILHDLIYKSLLKIGVNSKFTYVFDDHDPMDDIPSYLDQKTYQDYLGKPLNRIPPPEIGFASYAEYFAQEFMNVFNKVGSHPEIIWASKLYDEGKMNSAIRECLDKVEVIRNIYEETYQKKEYDNWFPFQVICPNCGKLSTTKVTHWDSEKVSFTCKGDPAHQIKGCEIESKISPFDGNGKLSWKVEWAAKWKVIGVTVEGAGKDHMSAGGSHDISRQICERVFNYPVPYPFAYEFLLVTGKKMSSSKGVGTSAKEISEILPPELVRLIMVRVNVNRTINFDPGGSTIPDLFDEYDDAARAYWGGKNKKLARIFELSQVTGKLPKEHFLPRFRDVALFLQHPEIDIYKKFESINGKKLTTAEKDFLEIRIKYAELWLDEYAPKEAVFMPSKAIPDAAKDLSDTQISYLQKVNQLLDQDWKEPEQLQQALFDASKNTKMSSKDAFASIYLSLIGKTHGPRAAWFLLEHSKLAKRRFQEVQRVKDIKNKIKYKFPNITGKSIISIDESITQAYPNMKIAMTVIKGVDNTKTKTGFEKYRQSLLDQLKDTTLEDINQSRKISSYRRAIRESGIDWHSRRPTMEALLRRIAQRKEISWINPLVDIGNLMAMKHQASQGVFDLDQVKAPIIMRKSAGGEKVLMIGDKKELTLKPGEICYFDQKGPFIVDLCWRDAQRTGATKKTKNVLFLSEAVYDITREEAEEVLVDLIKTVTKYCGGKVIQKGIITAS